MWTGGLEGRRTPREYLLKFFGFITAHMGSSPLPPAHHSSASELCCLQHLILPALSPNKLFCSICLIVMLCQYPPALAK